MNTLADSSPRFRGIGLALLATVVLVGVAFGLAVYGRGAAPTTAATDSYPVAALEPTGVPAAALPAETGLLLPSAAFSLYLPSTYHTLAIQQPIFGVQMNEIAVNHGLTRVVEGHSNWVRAGGVNWAAVEGSEGVYNWAALAPNEAQWIKASQNGLRLLVVVGGTPGWAQEHPGVSCGSIRPEKLLAFGNFLNQLVQRYNKPPHNLKYFEIWNEPDVDPAAVPGDSTFGCWGDPSDAYYGGGYYAEMLHAVYPRIKAADPSAQVVIGGLLLDCNPNNPPPGKDCKSSKFFEGILRQTGGLYFDGVGVHGYDAYGGTLGTYSSPNWGSASTNTSGPTTGLEAKVDYVRGLMSTFGVTGKFVMNNESAVGRFAQDSNPDYESTKAYYVAEVYATAAAKNLLANIWYSLDDDWHHQALLNPDNSPRPAFFAYKVAAEQLAYAKYVHPVTGFPGVKGYVFNVLGHDLWLVWSQDNANHVLTLPGTPASIRTVYGDSVAVNGTQLSLGPEPRYVEWAP